MNTFSCSLFPHPLLSSLPVIDGFSKKPKEIRESSYPYMMEERVQLAQLSYPNNNKDLWHRDQTENYELTKGTQFNISQSCYYNK